MPQPRPIKLGSLRFDRCRIAFIGDQDHRLVGGAQSFGNKFIESGHARPNIHHEKNECRLLDGGIDLPLNQIGEIVAIFIADSAGIEEFEETFFYLNGRGNAIARDAGVGSTMAMRRPARQLNNDDLPTLGRPTIATTGSATAQSPSKGIQ